MARHASSRPDGQDSVAAAFAAVIDEAIDGGGNRQPAEQVLSRWFRQRPGLGRRDRGRIADGVYHLLRHRRLFEALARDCSVREEGGIGNGNHGRFRTLDDVPQPEHVEHVDTDGVGDAVVFTQQYYECTNSCST